jgi:hypothetical protein
MRTRPHLLFLSMAVSLAALTGTPQRRRCRRCALWCAELLDGLDDFDFALEEVVDEIGEFDAFPLGVRGEPGLHRLVEVDGQLERGARLVELAALALAEIVFAFHIVTLV